MPEDQNKQNQSGNVFQAPQDVEPSHGEPILEPSLTMEDYQPPPGQGGGDTGISDIPPAPEEESGGFPFRIIFMIILAILIIGGAAYFILNFLKGGTGPNGPSGPASLTYWGLWEPEEVMQTIIEDYKKDHPNIEITYKQQSTVQYRERLQAAIERGEGPDIFRFHNTWLPMFKKQLAPIPDNVMTAEEFQKTFYAVAQDDLLMDGKFYGIPLYIDGLLLYYNKNLLSSVGISNPPSTWQEFEDYTARITVKDGFGRIQTSGAAMGLAENVEHFSDVLGLIMYQNGVKFPDLTSQEAVQALTYYTLFAQKPNNIWDELQDNSIVAFAGGKVGFIFAPSWQVFEIKQLNPSLNFGVAPVPQLGGATPVAWASYWVEGVSNKSSNSQAAYEFLKYLSSKDVMTKLYSEQAKLREFGEAYSRTDLASTLEGNEFLAPVLVQAPDMRSWYMASRTNDNGIDDRIIKYFENAVSSVKNGSSPAGAMDTAARGVKEVLDEYGVK